MNYDLVIRDGLLVIPGEGLVAANLGVSEGRIAALVPHSDRLRGTRVVDARGRHLFPGVIDSHTHIGIGNGYEDFGTETRAAALGGVTSVLLFLRQPESYRGLFPVAVEAGRELASIDFGFHAVVMTDEQLREVPSYITDLGITSFKFYMTYRGDDARMRTFDLETASFAGIDDGFMFDLFRAAAADPRALVMVHCENIEVIRRVRGQLKDAGEDSMEAWARSRPALAEVDGVRRALVMAEAAGANLHILHLTTAGGLAEVRDFKRRYPRAYVEVCHPYLVCDVTTFGEDRRGKMRPPLRTPADRDALWQGVAEGTVDSIGSDHVPRPLASKEGTVWSLGSGAPGTPWLLPAMLSEGHHRRGIPLERIADLCSRRPAILYGLHPRKGSLAVGADADITVVDLQRERVVRAAELAQASDFSLYEGMTLRGWPVETIVRGRSVMVEGEYAGEPGWGEYLSR
jgi:dihydropyrimidinase